MRSRPRPRLRTWGDQAKLEALIVGRQTLDLPDWAQGVWTFEQRNGDRTTLLHIEFVDGGVVKLSDEVCQVSDNGGTNFWYANTFADVEWIWSQDGNGMVVRVPEGETPSVSLFSANAMLVTPGPSCRELPLVREMPDPTYGPYPIEIEWGQLCYGGESCPASNNYSYCSDQGGGCPGG